MKSVKKILIVDDNEDLRETLAEQLHLYEEFDTDGSGDGATTLKKIRNNSYDLILLDIGLPDMDGRDLCRLIRREGVKAPIIMLTAEKADADTILSLDSGASDYITKPFKTGILMARIRAQLRQFNTLEGPDAVLTIGPYKFRVNSRLLIDEAHNHRIRLTDKEASILRYLHRAGDKVTSRDELLEQVWGYKSGITTHTLETHVYRLRQKIESDPSKAEILVTESGGYRLSC